MVFIIGIIDLKYFNWKKKEEKKEEKKEGKKKERKKGRKNFLKVVNLFPLNIVFSIVCVFPLLTFKLLLKVILHFIPERTNWKQNKKTKSKKQKQKKFFSNRVVHMWTKKINYLNWLKMKTINFIFYDPFSWLILK